MTQSFADPGSSGSELQRQVSVDLSADVSGYTSGMQQALAQTQALSGALGQAAAQADSLSKRMGKQLVHFAVGDFASLSGAVAVAGRFQSQLATLNATAAVTGSSMPALKRQLSGVFTDFPVWREQIVQLASAIEKLGVSKPQDVGTLTRSYIKLGAATGEDSSGLASSGVQLARQMGNLDPTSIDKYNNALLTLSKTAGVSATAVSEFAQNLAPFARQAGIGEAAVLGIATAFQKAGADGNVAANAFNNIVGQITSLTQTGSPDIAKYSSFLGKSNQQFKAMTGTEQATQIFEKVAQGGPQAAQFLSDQGGTRAVSAIQKVAQTGDLRSQIALAQGSSQDTKNLDKGSAAAMGGFNDAITSVRNAFTELATAIGEPLLGPLTSLAKAFGGVVNTIATFVKALHGAVTVGAVAAGAVALPAAFGLAHMGVATASAVGRAYLGQGSGWRTAMREGREAGVAVQGGMDPTRARAMGTLGGTPLPTHLQGLYNAQYEQGLKNGPAGPGLGARIGQTPIGMAFTQGRAGGAAPTGAGVAGMASNAAYAAGSLRLRPAAGRVGAFLAESQTQPFDDARRGAAQRDWAQRQRGEDPTDGRSNIGRIGRSFRRAPYQASAQIGQDVASAGRALGGPIGGVATGAGRAWSGISRAASGAAGLLGPAALLATIGIPLVGSLVSGYKDREAKQQDVTGALSGASKYDQALDSSSTNLAKFGGAVDDAANRLSKFASSDVSTLTKVTGEDIGAVSQGNYQVSDQALKDVVKASGGDKNAITSYFKSMGIQAGEVTGDRFTKYKQDLLSTMGVSRKKDVEDIMSTLATGTKATGGLVSGADFTALGTAAQGATGEEFKNVVGAGVSGIQAASAGTGQKGELARLSNLLHLGATATAKKSPGQNEQIEAVANEIASATGVDSKDFQKQIWEAAKKLKTGSVYYPGGAGSGRMSNLAYTNEADASKVLSLAYANSAGGKANLDAMGISASALFSGAATGMAFPSQAENDTQITTLRGRGTLGRQLAGIKSVGTSLAAPDNPFVANQAQQQILATAQKQAGGDNNQAEANLRKLADQSGGATNALGALMLAAADTASGLSSLSSAVQTKPQQAVAAAGRYNDLKAVSDTNSSTANVQATQGAATAAQGAAVGMLDYGRGLVQQGQSADKANQRAVEDNARQIQLTNDSYGREAARSAEDAARSRDRSERNFERSSLRASEDYYRNRERQTLEFNISQQRAEESYNRQRERTIEDFNIQAQRSEEEYNRDRLRTIEDFNIQAERAETSYQLQRSRQIEEAGISEHRAVVQNNLQNARATEDYNLSKARQQEDFNTSQARATADFNLQMARQAEDAAKSIYDPFARIQRQGTASAASVVRNLGNQNKAMTKQLTELQQAKDMGLSADTIKTLNLADPKNAQQLDSIIKGLGTNPKLAAQMNAEIQQRLKASKSLVTSQYSTEYGRQVEDFAKQQDRAREDLRKGMARGDDDFRKSMGRSAHDFGVSISNSRADLSRSLSQSAHDYRVSVVNSEADLRRNLHNSAVDFATGVAHSEADLRLSLTRSATDFGISVQQATDDFSRSLDQAATDFGISQQRAKEDQATALSDMATDFATTAARASSDHAIALDNMATAYKTQQDRAAEDLKDSFRTYTEGFGTLMTEMTGQATGAMASYAPEAAAAYLSAIADIGQGVSELINVPGVQILIGPPASFTSGHSSNGLPGPFASQPGTLGPNMGYADGGISLNQQYAMVSEKGPEAHIPLNTRGEDFMAGLIAKSLARGVTAAVSSTDGGASSSTSNTHVVSFSGADIKVVAQDPGKMARELEAIAKLKRLTSPN